MQSAEANEFLLLLKMRCKCTRIRTTRIKEKERTTSIKQRREQVVASLFWIDLLDTDAKKGEQPR